MSEATINETPEEVEVEEPVYSTLEERLVALDYEVSINTEDSTLTAEGRYSFTGDQDTLDRIFLTGSSQEAFSALMSGEVEVTEFDPRDYTDNAERWKVVKEFTEAITGARQNPVTRNLTPSEIAAEGRKRDLSRGRPSKWAQALILHTDVTGEDVAAWTLSELGVEGRNFKAFAIANGIEA